MRTRGPNVHYLGDTYNADRPDPRPGAYYVSAVDGPRYALVLGPFPTHAAALDHVQTVRRYCTDRDPRTWFAGFGTCRLDVADTNPAGKLNDVAELAPLLDAWRETSAA